MRKQINLLFISMMAVCVLSSCVSKKKFDQLINDKEAIDQMLADQQTKVKTLEGDLESLKDEKTKLESDFNAERTNLNNELGQVKNDLNQSKEEIAKVQKMMTEKENKYNTLKTEVEKTFGPFENNGLGLTAKGTGLYVSPPIHYKSGSTRISDEGKQKLQSIANALGSNPRLRIVIEGHTDSVPLKEGAAFKNNMELSYARANRVSRELVKLGVNRDQISTVGRSHKMPAVTDATTPEDRANNRRTEFVVVPDATGLYQVHKGN